LKEVWGDVSVEEGNVGVQVAKIRKVLGDERKQEYLETIHGEGYRFVPNVREKLEELYPEELKKARLWPLAVLILIALTAVGARTWWVHARNIQAVSTTFDARSSYERGLKHEAEGDDEQALADLNEAVAIDKGFADAYLRAAFVSNQIGEEDQAFNYLMQAKNCAGTRSEHQRLQIDALEAELSGGYQEAVKKYRLLVDAYPTDIASQYYFADFAMQSRSGFLDAGSALERCLHVDPANPYCNFDRMMLYVMTNNFDKAIALYESTSPRIHYPWFDEPFGVALYGKGDLDKAREVLRTFSRRTRSRGTSYTTGREWLTDIDFF
jgi:tetratricopeptide (TPR) repeat protein